MSFWRLLALAAILVSLVACSGVQVSHVLDSGGASRQISHSLGTTFGIAPPPVHCPGGIKVVTGLKFDCTTELGGQPLVVHVTLDDNSGRFTPRPAAAVLVVAKVVGAIETDVRLRNGLDASVDCGSRTLLVKAPGDTFRCTTQSGPVTRIATVTVQDVEGSVRYQLAGPVGSGGPKPGRRRPFVAAGASQQRL